MIRGLAMDFDGVQCAASYALGQSCIGSVGWGASGGLYQFLNTPAVVLVGSMLIGLPLIAFLLSRFLDVVLSWRGGGE